MNPLQIAHLCLTIISLLGTLVLGWAKFFRKDNDKELERDAILVEEMHKIKTELAVLKERMSNQIKIVHDINRKLDKVIDECD